MADLRTQIREAIRSRETDPSDPAFEMVPDQPWFERYADAAYEVVEPLLRALVAGEPYADMNDCGYMTCFFCLADETRAWYDRPENSEVVIDHTDDCAWVRAKEALGPAPEQVEVHPGPGTQYDWQEDGYPEEM